jgi:hypothetical protein
VTFQYGSASEVHAYLPPVVVGAFSADHVFIFRSYVYPGAFCSASLVVFITGWQLLSFFRKRMALNGTATVLSPMPRKPPTEEIFRNRDIPAGTEVIVKVTEAGIKRANH